MADDLKEAMYGFHVRAERFFLTAAQTVELDRLVIKQSRDEEMTEHEKLIVSLFTQVVAGTS